MSRCSQWLAHTTRASRFRLPCQFSSRSPRWRGRRYCRKIRILQHHLPCCRNFYPGACVDCRQLSPRKRSASCGARNKTGRTGIIPKPLTASRRPLTPTLSPRGEGVSCGLSSWEEDHSGVPSPLGERVGVRGASPQRTLPFGRTTPRITGSRPACDPQRLRWAQASNGLPISGTVTFCPAMAATNWEGACAMMGKVP